VISGIGQGYWKVTLLQLARGVAALADNGWRNRLHLVRERRDGYNAPWKPLPQPTAVRISDNADHLRVVAEGMMQTMQPGGTGAAVARGAPYVIAGKTGTAQNTSRKGNISVNPHALPLSLRHQAWFIAYAPVDNPRIAVAVMVEHGGFGASTAGPIARKIMDAYLLGKVPEPERDPEVITQSGAQAANANATAVVGVPPAPAVPAARTP